MDESTARSRHPDSYGAGLPVGAPPDARLVPDCAVCRGRAGAGGDEHHLKRSWHRSSASAAFRWGLQHYRRDQTWSEWPQPLSQLRRLYVSVQGISPISSTTPGLANLKYHRSRHRTGGNISNIYGTIQTTDFGDANLFLVNPSGIVFGPQGSFDVGGSVSMSTADYLRFEGTSTLFDMLSDSGIVRPARCRACGGIRIHRFGAAGSHYSPGQHAPSSGRHNRCRWWAETLPFRLRPFEDGTMQAANLRAPGGQIQSGVCGLAWRGACPEFPNWSEHHGASFTTMGTVTIKEGSTLDVSGQLDEFGTPIGNGNSGTVLVRGGQLVMDASTIQAITWGAVDGASTAVDIQVSQDVALTNGSTISTVTSGSGRGGDVQLTAPTLTIENDSPVDLDGNW